MKKRLINAVELCLQSIEAGASLDESVNKFPDLAQELRELLITAEFVKQLSVDTVSEKSMEDDCREILRQANKYALKKKEDHVGVVNWLARVFQPLILKEQLTSPFAGKLILALGIALILITLSGGMLITSAKSLPGDSLYPVKRVVEDITIYFAPNGEIRHEFEDTYSKKRVDEVMILLRLTRAQRISFEALVANVDGNQWIVGGIPVIIQPETMIITGRAGITLIEPGMRVEIEGTTTSEGKVLADEVHLQEYEYIGKVEQIEKQNWVISGLNLKVPAYVRIDPDIQVGELVIVLVHSDDGGLSALSISRYGQPTSSPSTDAQAEDTPEPSKDNPEEYGPIHETIGRVESIGLTSWVISGTTYQTRSAEIDGNITNGDVVIVKYQIADDGTTIAVEIKGAEKQEDPESLATPETSDEGETKVTEEAEPTEEEEADDCTSTPEHQETPEPTEDH